MEYKLNEQYKKVTFLNKVMQKCWNACITLRYRDMEPQTGEVACLYRCVDRYKRVREIIDEEKQKI
jgi:hypothetical protein